MTRAELIEALRALADGDCIKHRAILFAAIRILSTTAPTHGES